MKKCISIILTLLLAFILQSGPVAAQFADHKPLLPAGWNGQQSVHKALPFSRNDPDPTITETVALLNADTVRKNLLVLQNFGSRFLGKDNRKEVAQWIANQFLSYGFTDVRLDSFLCNIYWPGILIDTLWQYNVIARLEGNSAPGEIYVIGGHYDSFTYEDKYFNAPGADDNGSATVVAMEVARAMKLMNYQPETTIEFTLWAAEELGLFGSKYKALEASMADIDIRYVLNLDMVANNPDSLQQVVIGKYESALWAADVAANAYSLYTGLEPIIPDDVNPSGSDSYSYYLFGFPAIFVQEITFSPHWHLISDTVGNCNIEYLTEVARGACATLMDQQNHPYPVNLSARSGKESVALTWSPTANANVDGYNIYRSPVKDEGYALINTVPVADTFYNDGSGIPGKEYFYRITAVNPLIGESLPSWPVTGALYAFTDTLLIVNTLRLDETTPDTIRQFYEAVMDTIPFEWYDLNKLNPLGVGHLASHLNILWTSNTQTFDPNLAPSYDLLADFFSNGGNMMVSAFTPTRIFGNNNQFPFSPGERSVMRDFFKVDSAFRKINALMYQAYPATADYDTLRADVHKAMNSGYPGEVYNVEVYRPTAEGTTTYRFDSHYPPTNPLGIMQDKPVGQEYIGPGYRTILLGFPLYYIDTADAKNLVKNVMTNKFTHPTGMPEPGPGKDLLEFSAWPNPFTMQTTLSFRTSQSAQIRLFVINMKGVVVAEIMNARLDAGVHRFNLPGGDLPPGLYQAILTTDNGVSSYKIVHIR